MSETTKRPSVKGKKRASSRKAEPAAPQLQASIGEKVPESEKPAVAAAPGAGVEKGAKAPGGADSTLPAEPSAPATSRPSISGRRRASKAGGLGADFIETDEDFFSPKASGAPAVSTGDDGAAAGVAGASGREGSGLAAGADASDRRHPASSLVHGTNWKKVVLNSLAVLLALTVVAGGAFVWHSFFRYDDAADIQGEWITDDGSMTVVIDAESINMPNNLPYAYTLDTWKKDISFDFGELSGSGSYSFSADRQHLTITEQDGDSVVITSLTRLSGNSSAKAVIVNGAQAGDGSSDAGASEESGSVEEGSAEEAPAGDDEASSEADSGQDLADGGSAPDSSVSSSASTDGGASAPSASETATLAEGLKTASNGAIVPDAGSASANG